MDGINPAGTPYELDAGGGGDTPDATSYRLGIDSNAQAARRLAYAFAPHEAGLPRVTVTAGLSPAEIVPASDKFIRAGHGLVTGVRMRATQNTSPVDLPAGLAEATDYWAIVLDADEFQLAASLADALSSPPVPVNITDEGSGITIFEPQPSMVVRLEAGALFTGGAIPTEVAGQYTGLFTAPSTNPRIDLVHVDRSTGAVGVTQGAESSSPSAPALPAGKLPVALVTLQTTTTVLTNQDITDIRALYPTTPGAAGGFAGLDANGHMDAALAAGDDGGSPLTYFGLKAKVLEIGDWNMDTTSTVTIPHGLTYAKIRAVQTLMRADVDALRKPIDFYHTSGPTFGGNVLVGTINITLERLTGGFYDSANYDATSYNRGWVIVWYEP